MKNKGLRQEVKMRYFKRRLKIYQYDKIREVVAVNSNVLRTTGKPCSCPMCRGERYSGKTKHKQPLLHVVSAE